MKAIIILLTGLAALLPSMVLAAPLKVLQLNFGSEISLEDPQFLIRDMRFNSLVKWVGENSPDIILLEESWSYRDGKNVAVSLANAIGYDYAYRLDLGFPGLFYDGDAILAKKKFHMGDERDLKLPHSAAEFGDGKNWILELGDVSFAVGVKLTQPEGRPLYVYATHLTASSESDRGDQAKAILNDVQHWVKADGEDWNATDVIIGGDFNSAPTSPSPLVFTQAGFADSFAVAHPGDDSCSDCEKPDQPWFNPIALAAGQVPSQAAFNSDLRDDYVFSHSLNFKPLSSTLVFTAPLGGVWMTDHYGVVSVLGDATVPPPPNPVRDTEGTLPDSQIIALTDDMLKCPEPDGFQDDADSTCDISLSKTQVFGARGVTISNQTHYYASIEIHGPGTIFANNRAGLNPGEKASFSFNTPGKFDYVIRTNGAPDSASAKLTGVIDVQKTGY